MLEDLTPVSPSPDSFISGLLKGLAEEWVYQNSRGGDDLRSDGNSTRPYAHILCSVNELETPCATRRIPGA